MKLAWLLALSLGCGAGARASSEPGPIPTAQPDRADPVASASAAPTVTAVPDAGAPQSGTFHVVKEAVHPREKATPFIARLGDREAGSTKLAPIDPKAGPLSGDAAQTACYVATGLNVDMDATCSAKIDAASASSLQATVEVDFENDTMQSRSKTHVTMKGTIDLDASHAVARASFRGQEHFAERSPCEKIDVCEKCDPLVRSAGCPAQCYCPFRAAGTAEVETSYTR